MMNSSKLCNLCAAALLSLSATSIAFAQPVLDGNASGSDGYGAALSVQNTQTQFGDNNDADLIANSGGSEIDQVFGVVSNGRLYVTIAGNLENNFNKMEVFIDSVARPGETNTLNGTNLPAAVDAFCCGGFGTTDGALQRMDGVVFDEGFGPDYYLTFASGGENVNTGDFNRGFFAVSAHYADLTNGASGENVAAGYQLAPRGLPNVLRGPLGGDFNDSGNTAGEDFLTWQRGYQVGTTKAEGDSNGDEVVDGADLATWQNDYSREPGLNDFPFNPFPGGPSTENVLLGPVLPGLAQGQLIDQTYSLGAGGCSADTTDGGTGCVAAELEFALPVDSNDTENTLNHRDFNNTVDLQMAFDNSNTTGVEGGEGAMTTGDPENVTTGLEFSIPLSQIGDPTGPIRITAFVNGSGHDFASNQFTGTGVLQANIGDPFFLELNLVDGDQFVTIAQPSAIGAVPEPSSIALLLLGSTGVCLLGRRR